MQGQTTVKYIIQLCQTEYIYSLFYVGQLNRNLLFQMAQFWT